jgi:hypothetical protein
LETDRFVIFEDWVFQIVRTESGAFSKVVRL